MPSPRGSIPSLRLEPVVGPALVGTLRVDTEHAVMGRAVDCQLALPHETVSRRHAALSYHAGQWFITDQGSRHGTTLNGVSLAANKPAAIETGDLLSLGPWTFRVSIGPSSLPTGTSIIASTIAPSGPQRVERVPERELSWMAQQRLDLLIRASARINAAPSEQQIYDIALDAARAGSGYSRAAWLRPVDAAADMAQVEVAACQPSATVAPGNFSFSQSLIREAATGQLARLTDENPPQDYGQSIVSLGIHSALCAPIMVGGAVAAYLYLDARGQESPVQAHAAGFCQALSQICGLALANMRREDLERRQQRIEAELAAAREAQQLIMPPASGVHGSLRYSMRNTPGRTVAGDLFDIVPLDEHRLAICLGDVSGKSIGAGLLMATTQAYLHAAIARYQDAARALIALNNYLDTRCAMDRFVTMWVGVLDARTGSVVFVDAGHGHWAVKRRGRAPERVPSRGGIPIAIDAEYQYVGESLALEPGDRLIVYSDGISEQRSPEGEEFGVHRLLQTIAESDDPQSDVDRLFVAVERFAKTHLWDDDATAASIELIPSP